MTDRFIVLCWSVFCGYWAIGSFRARLGATRHVRSRLSALLVVPAIALIYFSLFAGDFPQRESPVIGLQVLGAVLCALGIAIAIWARACLGRNWGMPMTKRKNPQLVTSGPYAYVRHPIYTGLLLAITGTILATDPAHAFGGPLAALIFFGISAIREERYMLTMFPEQYRAYVKRTWRLIPFLW